MLWGSTGIVLERFEAYFEERMVVGLAQGLQPSLLVLFRAAWVVS